MGQFEFVKEARHAFVDHSDAVPARGLRQGAGQPGFTHAAGASEHQIAFILDPATRQHLLEQGLVEAASGNVIDVF